MNKAMLIAMLENMASDLRKDHSQLEINSYQSLTFEEHNKAHPELNVESEDMV